MNPQRFDKLALAAAGTSRRGALKAVAGGLASGLAAVTGRRAAADPDSGELGATVPIVGGATVVCRGPGTTNCCSTDAVCFYLTPDGSDTTHRGTSEEDAVRTLSKVQDLIKAYVEDYTKAHGPFNKPIEVRIKAGFYRQTEAVKWDYYTPGYSVSFMPSDYRWGVWGSFKARPVFSGSGVSKDSYWFQFYRGPGESTRLGFYYLEVRNYARGGLVLEGPNSPGKWNGYNTVFGMYFRFLGTRWAGGPVGYAGVFLVNSRNNLIQNNHFVHLENDIDESPGAIHAVYMKNWANNNVIRDNRMADISGDGVRVRNESNDNDIRANDMTRTGEFGFFSDWYRDPSGQCTEAKHTEEQECPSWRNWFRYNTLRCGFDGSELPAFHFYQDRYCVPPGCDDPKADRLQTGSNQLRCP